jgi:hypothetical protein
VSSKYESSITSLQNTSLQNTCLQNTGLQVVVEEIAIDTISVLVEKVVGVRGFISRELVENVVVALNVLQIIYQNHCNRDYKNLEQNREHLRMNVLRRQI